MIEASLLYKPLEVMSKVHLLRIYSYDENDLPKTKKNKEKNSKWTTFNQEL